MIAQNILTVSYVCFLSLLRMYLCFLLSDIPFYVDFPVKSVCCILLYGIPLQQLECLNSIMMKTYIGRFGCVNRFLVCFTDTVSG